MSLYICLSSTFLRNILPNQQDTQVLLLPGEADNPLVVAVPELLTGDVPVEVPCDTLCTDKCKNMSVIMISEFQKSCDKSHALHCYSLGIVGRRPVATLGVRRAVGVGSLPAEKWRLRADWEDLDLWGGIVMPNNGRAW